MSKEAIDLLNDTMSLLYDTIHPMPKSAILSHLSKLKLLLESEPERIEPANCCQILIDKQEEIDRLEAENKELQEETEIW